MKSILSTVSSHTLVLPDLLVAALASSAFAVWEYLRLGGSSGRFRDLVAVPLFADSRTVLSGVLILFRFTGVER